MRAPPQSSLAAASSPPEYWAGEVGCVLINEEQLEARVTELAAELQDEYEGQDLVIVALLNGTVLFLADLIRRLTLPLRLDFVGISSYGAGRTSGKLIVTKELRLDVRGRDVLLLDDILDTGRTIKHVKEKLESLKPKSLKVCVLLDKKSRRVEPIEADYAGFEIPDAFVVGYGLDYAEKYRNLPFVGVLKDAVFKS